MCIPYEIITCHTCTTSLASPAVGDIKSVTATSHLTLAPLSPFLFVPVFSKVHMIYCLQVFLQVTQHVFADDFDGSNPKSLLLGEASAFSKWFSESMLSLGYTLKLNCIISYMPWSNLHQVTWYMGYGHPSHNRNAYSGCRWGTYPGLDRRTYCYPSGINHGNGKSFI